jgi:hypothetical protein
MNCFHAQLDSALVAAESLKKSPNCLAMDKFNLAAGSRSALLMVCLGLGALALAPIAAKAHMNGMYETQAAAEKRAAELKCKGTFKMDDMYMPCSSERALHEALQKSQ